MGLLSWLVGSGDDEIDDGEIWLSSSPGQILARDRTGATAIVWDDEDVEAFRAQQRHERINGRLAAIQQDTGKVGKRPENEKPRRGASAEEIFSGYQ